MTPHETNLCIQAYAEKYKAEQEERISIAYVQAMWTIQWLGKKKPKSLKEMLEKPKKKMTPEEMLEEVRKMNLAMGGTTY